MPSICTTLSATSLLLAAGLGACGVAQAAEVVPVPQELFGGELRLKPDGFYTLVHYYSHPETGRQAIVAGMNHVGDPEYYREADRILSGADAVVHEGDFSEAQPEEAAVEEAPGAPEASKDGDLSQAFQAAMQLYFSRAEKSLGLPSEWTSFDYHRPGWVSADKEFGERLARDPALQKKFAELEGELSAVPEARSKEIIAHVHSNLAKMDAGKYTARDLAESMRFFWSDQELVALFQELVGHPRDEVALEVFDRVVQEQNPKTIALKFGAAHVSHQRKLLEARGYVHQKSVELRNIQYAALDGR